MAEWPAFFSALEDLGVTWYLQRFSALDHYHRIRYSHGSQTFVEVLVEGDTVDLARSFEHLDFVGLPVVDAAVTIADRRVHFQTVDVTATRRRAPFSQQNLLYDVHRRRYIDHFDVYCDLRRGQVEGDAIVDPETAGDALVLLSRYPYRLAAEPPPTDPRADDERRCALLADRCAAAAIAEQVADEPERPSEYLRKLVTNILTGRQPWIGLSGLRSAGFLARYLPELLPMDSVSHSKEGHPEGNVWTHVLETFRYRKVDDIRLNLALLLHDCGKAFAGRDGERVFDGHAEIGEQLARRILRRLGFAGAIVEDVAWLVKNHMYPAAIPRMPVRRTEHLMRSPLFPTMLELFRCDLSSTFRGPAAYYAACETYRTFKRHHRNPYRDTDGRKSSRGRNNPIMNHT